MKILRLFVLFALSNLWTPVVLAAEMQTIAIAFISQKVDQGPALSTLLEEPDDLGLQGARLGLKDNNTTGRFLKQKYELNESLLPENGDAVLEISKLIKQGYHSFVLDLPPKALSEVLKEIKDEDVLFFNARARDNDFRQQACDLRLLHTIPSRAMLGDALAQYMVKKRWAKWLLIKGQREEDVKFASSLKRSAHKFGAKIVEHKSWDGARDARRTAQAEVPLLTQGADYDVLMVADEIGDFGEFLMYRTFDPRPVAGTQGLFPTGWFWTQEQWGAQQLQSRFHKLAKRFMGERDYAAWAAVRTLGEAATRTKSNTYQVLHDYIKSDEFELAAFKGRKLSYRSWNGQLRQPIALTSARSLVAQAPLEGFLHRVTDLDTLGFDQGESKCKEWTK